jgi:peptidoglycan/xylan/chitin deacetylase (PgdA/CDA1 family)
MGAKNLTRKSFFAAAFSVFMLASQAAFAWPAGCISALPKSSTRRVAWTVDDGISSSALGRYVTMLERNPTVKITFFVLSGAPGWAKYAKRLKALQDRGQIQLANHTATHRKLTTLSDAKIKAELMKCENFCLAKYGTTSKPYFRPPYGEINSRVIRVAASIGFTKPILWYGSFASGSGVKSSTVLKMATKWIANGRIVIDHANGYCTTNVFPQILKLFTSRKLRTVTLREVMGPQ